MLAQPENVMEWIEALDELSENLQAGYQMAQNAFDHYEAFYTWEKRAASLIKMSSAR